ncbi:ATP-dependent DNA helicase [Methanotorris igneus]|uniref:Exodeoxyribonuclease V n=1 Tax=Methanotorris igneus (strain DSM 5666 / JCM 11834 / Kol 5) TaxID=880724 RepID=F6BF62_METIK|nr:ATP-dependent RecD-like DNA helicase [Methanotorris igneus]AEF96932.1 Exodeoxyribonuclease V [Methanotorris igneus Kol 5]
MKNLVSLVAWHDSGWNGRFCRKPEENRYCESFKYVKFNKYNSKLCLNNPSGVISTIPKGMPCHESVMFIENNNVIKEGGNRVGRIPTLLFSNVERFKEILDYVKGKYTVIHVRENPLSDNKVIIGCVKIKEIINKDEKNKNKLGFEIDFDLEDIVFTLPYQEFIEFCKDKNLDYKEFEHLVVFDVEDFSRYFRGMCNIITDKTLIEILKKAIEILEGFNKFIEEYPDFMEYLKGNKAFRPWVMKDFDKFLDRIKNVISELEGREYKYPGLPAVIYYLGDKEAYSKYFEAVESNKEEELYKELKESLEKRKENSDFKNEFKEFLLNYAVYYDLMAYDIKIIKEQIKKGFISLEEILENPYVLVEDLKEKEDFSGFSFIEVDSWEQRRVKDFDKHNPYRIRALLVEILKRLLKHGHTTVTTGEVKNIFDKIGVDISFKEFLEMIEKNEEIIKEKVVIEEKIIGNEKVKLFTLKDIKESERVIEETINKMLDKPKEELRVSKEEIEKLLRNEKKEDEDYKKAIEMQIEAVEKLLKNRVGILTGPAGTGKTTVISTLVKILKDKYGYEDIYILTPTGKSAMVIREKLKEKKINNVKVMTIHRFIAQEFSDYFNFDFFVLRDVPENAKKKVYVLILDESSMIDTKILGNLFKCVDIEKHLVFVGDINQLPPVDAGKPFHDIYRYLERVNKDAIAKLEIPLRSESKKIAEFSEIFLMDGEERKIKLEELLKEKEVLDNKEIYRIRDGEKEVITIEVVKDNLLKALEDAIEKILEENSKDNFFEFAVFDDKLEILSPTKTKGELNSYIINLYIRQDSKFVPEKYRDKMKLNLFYGNKYVADKVIQTKNKYKKGIYNGMMGYVYFYNKNYKKYAIKFYSDENERRPYVYVSDDNIEHAYAITIHKSQGSGFENIIVAIPKGLNKFVSKEMLYTAVTRAKKRLWIIVEESLENLINVYNSELRNRKTNLFDNFDIDSLIPFYEERAIETERGEKVRSEDEKKLADIFHKLGIEYEYEPISEYLKLGVLPDFKLCLGDKEILWEHYGVDSLDYRLRQREKEEIYKKEGYKIIKLGDIDNAKLDEKVVIISTPEDLNCVEEKIKILLELVEI